MDNKVSLDFNNICRLNFDFLVSLYGFCSSVSDNHYVIYKNNKIEIILCHDKFSYEVFLLFSNNELQLTSYELYLILCNKKINYIASTYEGVCTAVKKLSQLISQNINLLIDYHSFYEIFKKCEKYKEDYEREFILNMVDFAWQEKRYHDVIELLSTVSFQLDLKNRKRLEYSLKLIHK